MNSSKIIITILGLSLTLTGIVNADKVANNKVVYENVTSFPKDRFLLLNLKSTNLAYILKEAKLVKIGEKLFISGIKANMGDDAQGAGITVYLLFEDVTSIRSFSWDQAKAYYSHSFKEQK